MLGILLPVDIYYIYSLFELQYYYDNESSSFLAKKESLLQSLDVLVTINISRESREHPCTFCFFLFLEPSISIILSTFRVWNTSLSVAVNGYVVYTLVVVPKMNFRPIPSWLIAYNSCGVGFPLQQQSVLKPDLVFVVGGGVGEGHLVLSGYRLKYIYHVWSKLCTANLESRLIQGI